MNQDDRKKVQELPPGENIEIPGYLSVITEELKEIEQQTGNRYGTLVTHRGAESFVRVTNLTKKPSLRGQVEQILQKLTPDNPVEIPKGTLAAQYAYAHAKHMGLRYRITDGKVSIADELSLRAQVHQILEGLTEDNPVQIPAGIQASNYAYTYAASMGKKCTVRNGIVTLSKETTPSLRSMVLTALEELTEENPVTIPPGIQAVQYAYAHARERGLRYKITAGGIVSLAPKQEETRKIDLLKRLISLEKGETTTEQVTQTYLRKVEDVSGYSFLLNDGDITRLK